MKEGQVKTKFKPIDVTAKPRATRLQEYRISKGFTQRQLADLLGVTLSAISNAERRRSALSQVRWYHLADLLEVDVRALQGYDKHLKNILSKSLPNG